MIEHENVSTKFGYICNKSMYHIVKIQTLIYVPFASKILRKKIRNPHEAYVLSNIFEAKVT